MGCNKKSCAIEWNAGHSLRVRNEGHDIFQCIAHTKKPRLPTPLPKAAKLVCGLKPGGSSEGGFPGKCWDFFMLFTIPKTNVAPETQGL